MTALTPEVLRFTGHGDLQATLYVLDRQLWRTHMAWVSTIERERYWALLGTLRRGRRFAQLPLEGGNG